MVKSIQVGVLGASGKLGSNIINALATQPFVSNFASVIAFGRSELDPTKLRALQESAGASTEVKSVKVDYDNVQSLTASFRGVDFLINANNFPAEEKESEKKNQNIIEAAGKSGIEVYVPSEFGTDWRIHDFEFSEWTRKKNIQIEARKHIRKVISIYTGLFIETAFGPWFGFNFTQNTIHLVGSSSVPTAYTSLKDIGKATASLASTFAQKGSEGLPDHIRIYSSLLSLDEVFKVFKDANEKNSNLQITSESLESFEKKLKELPEGKQPTLFDWITLAKAKGIFDFSQPLPKSLDGLQGEGLQSGIEASREFVEGFEWSGVDKYANEVGGRPFA